MLNDWNVVLRHTDNQKWYGLIIEVGRNKLGLPGDGEVDILNVKSDPMLIGSYRTQEGFFPAYHMNKENSSCSICWFLWMPLSIGKIRILI